MASKEYAVKLGPAPRNPIRLEAMTKTQLLQEVQGRQAFFCIRCDEMEKSDLITYIRKIDDALFPKLYSNLEPFSYSKAKKKKRSRKAKRTRKSKRTRKPKKRRPRN